MPLVQLSTAQINYEDHSPTGEYSGTNEPVPVVLVHGFSSSIADNWKDTQWIKVLRHHGFRVVALDNRGHGASEKFYSDGDYNLDLMAGDVVDLLDHLEISTAHLVGYSMGARISSKTTILNPGRVKKLVIGGNGYGMIGGSGDWGPVLQGLRADSVEEVSDVRAREFRLFAERTGSDLKALAACLDGTRELFTEEEFASIDHDVLIAIGTKDVLAGSGEKLADLMKNARYFPIPDRDHMRATGDRSFKSECVEFLKNG